MVPFKQNYTPYQYLDLPAKCAIEYLDAQGYGHRSIEKLNLYLDHYYKAYGMVCDEHTRESCIHIATRRFSLEQQDAEASASAAS